VAAKRDYYEVLGVERDASTPDVKRAYRKLAMKHHPDRNPDDPQAEEAFKEAAEAFEVINDGEKRQLYDRFGHEGPRGAGFQGFSGTDEIFTHFGDLFGDLFGFGGGRRNGPQRGADLKMRVVIPFAEAISGSERELSVPRREVCDDCDGNGAARGSKPKECHQCGGKGQVVHRQGFFTLQTTCPLCRGEGTIIDDPCQTCSGSGVVQREANLDVKIPAGVDDGQVLRIPGGGQPGTRGGPAGNLYVQLRVEPDARFERDEFDVHSEVTVSAFQAMLGCRMDVPTLDGETQIDIDAGTQPGAVIRRRGEGIPILGGRGKGDHLVHVAVQIPTKLNTEQEQQVRDLAADLGDDVAPPKKGLLSSLLGR
jgi:molecular chaperone DnaJ